jgi:multiple sugar transport system permease protein
MATTESPSRSSGERDETTEFVAPPAARRFGWLTDKRLGRLAASPAGLLLIALFLFPLLYALVLSFTNYSATRSTPTEWVWFGNYITVLTSTSVLGRAITTAIFVLAAVGAQAILGVGIAYLISRQPKWAQGVLTVLFLIPMVFPRVIVGAFWTLMLDAQFGVINGFLGYFGIEPLLWLTDSTLALISIIMTDTWQWTPFIMVIAVAGFTGVPKYLYEAAEIDRGSDWFKFRHITMPLVWPLLLIAVLFRAIDAYRLFEIVFVVTGGGPGSATETLSYQLYEVAFRQFDTGLASAYGVLMALLIIILGKFYVNYLNRVQAR